MEKRGRQRSIIEGRHRGLEDGGGEEKESDEVEIDWGNDALCTLKALICEGCRK